MKVTCIDLPRILDYYVRTIPLSRLPLSGRRSQDDPSYILHSLSMSFPHVIRPLVRCEIGSAWPSALTPAREGREKSRKTSSSSLKIFEVPGLTVPAGWPIFSQCYFVDTNAVKVCMMQRDLL